MPDTQTIKLKKVETLTMTNQTAAQYEHLLGPIMAIGNNAQVTQLTLNMDEDSPTPPSTIVRSGGGAPDGTTEKCRGDILVLDENDNNRTILIEAVVYR